MSTIQIVGAGLLVLVAVRFVLRPTRPSLTGWVLIPAFVVALVLFAGCGGTERTARPLEPTDVAREYVIAAYRCGELGAGRAYDLSMSTARTWSRSTFIAEERRHGCTPQPVPDLQITRGPRGQDTVVVYVQVIPSPDTTEGRAVLTFTLRRTDTSPQWRVDTQASSDPEWLTAS